MSTTFVIFGASGDLTGRKLIPALYRLYLQQRLPANMRIVGFCAPTSATRPGAPNWRSRLSSLLQKRLIRTRGLTSPRESVTVPWISASWKIFAICLSTLATWNPLMLR